MIAHHPFQNIVTNEISYINWIKQRSVADSIKEKCDLINHLYAGSTDWSFNKARDQSNNITINGLLTCCYQMLHTIKDHYLFDESQHDIEEVLIELKRFEDAKEFHNETNYSG
jgi:hypothetical protein